MRQHHRTAVPARWLAAGWRWALALLLALAAVTAASGGPAWALQGGQAAPAAFSPSTADLAGHAGHGHAQLPAGATADASPSGAAACSHCPLGHALCTCAVLVSGTPLVAPKRGRAPWHTGPGGQSAGVTVPPETPPPIA